MFVTPIPVFLLLVLFQLAIIPVSVSVGFTYPVVVIHALVVVPDVIVGVIGVVIAIAHADSG